MRINIKVWIQLLKNFMDLMKIQKVHDIDMIF
jgi:hypothetical protein